MNNLFVADLTKISLEKMVESKLKILIEDQQQAVEPILNFHNMVMECAERPMIRLILNATFNNLEESAKLLGLSKESLIEKIDKYGMNNEK